MLLATSMTSSTPTATVLRRRTTQRRWPMHRQRALRLATNPTHPGPCSPGPRFKQTLSVRKVYARCMANAPSRAAPQLLAALYQIDSQSKIGREAPAIVLYSSPPTTHPAPDSGDEVPSDPSVLCGASRDSPPSDRAAVEASESWRSLAASPTSASPPAPASAPPPRRPPRTRGAPRPA